MYVILRNWDMVEEFISYKAAETMIFNEKIGSVRGRSSPSTRKFDKLFDSSTHSRGGRLKEHLVAKALLKTKLRIFNV